LLAGADRAKLIVTHPKAIFERQQTAEVKAALKKSRQIRAPNFAAAAADSPPPPGLAKSDDLALEFANSHTQLTHTLLQTLNFFFSALPCFRVARPSSSELCSSSQSTSSLSASQPAGPVKNVLSHLQPGGCAPPLRLRSKFGGKKSL
jgi:hypothetical protein